MSKNGHIVKKKFNFFTIVRGKIYFIVQNQGGGPDVRCIVQDQGDGPDVRCIVQDQGGG